MKARIPKHREFIIDFPKDMDQVKADEGWNKLNEIVEEYKKAHNGQSVYAPTFIEDCEPAVKKLQEEYGFTYTIQEIKYGIVHFRRSAVIDYNAAKVNKDSDAALSGPAVLFGNGRPRRPRAVFLYHRIFREGAYCHA